MYFRYHTRSILLSIVSFLFPPLYGQRITPTIFGNNRERAYAFADSLMREMTNREKLAQMLMITVYPKSESKSIEEFRTLIKRYNFGGLLWQKGSAGDAATMTNVMRRELKIPMIVGMDGEWGLSMRLQGTIQYPKNMTLGAITDLSLIKEYGKAIATEAKRMGIHLSFAPVLDVNDNPNNPVIGNRSFGSNPSRVSEWGIAYARGLEENRILSCAKHFPGHGNTDLDSHKALPIIKHNKAHLDSVEVYPFRQYINRGMGGVMVGHLDVPALGTKGGPSSLTPSVVTELLQKELGFDGLIFTDGLGMRGVQLPAGRSIAVEAFLAGNDILLASQNPVGKLQELMQALKGGRIDQKELDRRCRKILAFKYILGVMDKTPIKLQSLHSELNTPAHLTLRDKLYESSLTLLKGEEGIVPMNEKDRNKRIAVLQLGDISARTLHRGIGKYCNASLYSVTSSMPKAKRVEVYQSLRKFDKIVLAITSEKYKVDEELASVIKGIPSSLIILSLPYELMRWKGHLTLFPVIAVGYEPTVAAQRAMARGLTGEIGFMGQLPVEIPSLFRVGDHTSLSSEGASLPKSRHNVYILPLAKMERIRSIAQEGLQKGAYPGCQVLIAKSGKIVYNEAFGHKDSRHSEKVYPNTIYDLASLTKALATLPLVMIAVDEGRLCTNDPIGKYLPWLTDPSKQKIRIQDLLHHTAGLPASIPFYKILIDKSSYPPPLISAKKKGIHTVKIGRRAYAPNRYQYLPSLVSPSKKEGYPYSFGGKYFLSSSIKDSILYQINEAPLRKNKYRYSDINFLILQQILESVYDSTLEKLFYDKIAKPLKLKRTLFNPLSKYPCKEIAEGTNDNFLRKSSLRGYVDDEAAGMLGGVAGNAGLFGTAEEIAVVAQMLLNEGKHEGQQLIKRETVRRFRTTHSAISPYLMGWDCARGKGKPGNTSELAPIETYGHTGFTGTCFWIDPINEWIFVFLSNRVCPVRWNSLLSSLQIRKRIQDVLYL